MIGKQEHIIEEIYNKVKYNVNNIFSSKGVSGDTIKSYLSKKRNFDNFLKNFGELRVMYGEREKPFNQQVREILDKVLADKIYYEKDHPVKESYLLTYDFFINKD